MKWLLVLCVITGGCSCEKQLLVKHNIQDDSTTVEVRVTLPN